MDTKKKNVSVRLANTDIKRLKEISSRLGVKEADLFRFSVKSMLSKLMPLHDKSLKGSDLIPALMECGEELAGFFDLDSQELAEIINAGVDDQHKRVDETDLDLLALSSVSGQYVVLKLSELMQQPVEPLNASDTLKSYLQEKYVNQDGSQAVCQDCNSQQSIRLCLSFSNGIAKTNAV